jgi:putative oxidoreductase
MAVHVSLGERLAYGTPIDPVVDHTEIHVVPRSTTALIGRLLIAALFLTSGVAKLVDTANTGQFMTAVGIPHAETLAMIAGVAEICGGLAIALGFLTRIGAIGLALYLIPTTLIFHSFWRFDEPEAKTQMVNFMKNLCIIGGLAMVFAFGPGRFSLDALLRRPKQP